MIRAWPKFYFILLSGLLALGFSTSVRAVIFYSTGDPDYNTTAPGGVLSNSGWQLVGDWIGFQGAPIGPHHFIAARHIGGSVGDTFVFNSVSYATTAVFDDAASDLRIWEVSGTFPAWASLYRLSNEVGRPLVVYGRGLTRGAEVRVGGVLKGWQWGAGDGRLRWGKNAVSSVVNGGSYWGQLLYATFDAAGGNDEAHLAVGDSSGPVFIHDGAEWALAGVAAAVDAYFNTTNSGSGFNAAIFDARGLYYSSDPANVPWQLLSGATPIPSGFYATRISARLGWIDSVVPPGVDAPLFDSIGCGVFALSLFGIGIFFLKQRRPLRRVTG